MFILISIKNKKEYVEIVDSMNIRKTDRRRCFSLFFFTKINLCRFRTLTSDYRLLLFIRIKLLISKLRSSLGPPLRKSWSMVFNRLN